MLIYVANDAFKLQCLVLNCLGFSLTAKINVNPISSMCLISKQYLVLNLHRLVWQGLQKSRNIVNTC